MRTKLALVATGGLLLQAAFAPATRGASSAQAGLIVVDGERVTSRCVIFDEPSISGEELLVRSGFKVSFEPSSLGAAVCSVDTRGCSSDDCFCDYPTFWGYWTADEESDGFTFSDSGATEREVVDGSVDAWVYGKDGGRPPGTLSADKICEADSGTRASAATRRNARTPRSYAGFVVLLVIFSSAALALAVRRRRTPN